MAILLLLATLLSSAPQRAAETKDRLVVIVGHGVSVKNLSMADLRRIYLGSMTRWPDGHPITPVVLSSNREEEREFLKRVVQMVEIDYAQHWIGEVFRGRAAAPPQTVASPAAALHYVESHPYAIAFVEATLVDTSVRTVTIDERSYDDPGYALAW